MPGLLEKGLLPFIIAKEAIGGSFDPFGGLSTGKASVFRPVLFRAFG